MKEIEIEGRVPTQDIRSEKISEVQLDEMAKLAGSYEALFSRRAMKYKALELDKKMLSEAEIRQLILGEYTFLKRPVLILEDEIFVGNAATNVQAAKTALS